MILEEINKKADKQWWLVIYSDLDYERRDVCNHGSEHYCLKDGDGFTKAEINWERKYSYDSL